MAALPFKPDDLMVEFDRCKPGEFVVYFRGYLPIDRSRPHHRGKVEAVASFAMRMATPAQHVVVTEDGRKLVGTGVGYLSQRRLGDWKYEYRLHRRKTSI